MNCFNPNANEPVLSRLICPPNAPPQIVSLLAGWWTCLDWMVAEKDESLETISVFCWRYVENHPEMDLDFAGVFNHYLLRYMMNHAGAFYDLGNDNYGQNLPDWEAMPHPYRARLTKRLSFCVPTRMQEKLSEFENHVSRHVNRKFSKRPDAANDNETGRDDVWEKLPHPYRIKLAKNFSFSTG